MAQEHSWQLLMEDNFQSAAVLQELIECKMRSAELEEAVREKAKIRKALKEEVEEKQQQLQKAKDAKRRTAPKKVTRQKEHITSLMQETVAVQLDEQTAAWKRSPTAWLRKFLLFLGLLQLVFVILVVLNRDILHWVLPTELATALGSRPPKPSLF